MTGPINFNIFKGVSGAENLYDLDKDKKAKGPEQPPEDKVPPVMEMNVGNDEDCELDLSALDPQKFPKDKEGNN